MLHASTVVNGPVLWANLHLLFWLSLVPFATGWMGENHFAPLPVALYAGTLFLSSVAYFILEHMLISCNPKDRVLAKAIGKDRKGMASMVLYLLAVPLAFVAVWASFTLLVLVAILWFLPDRRIEAAMRS
jgi:uncharacterized membrane protein